MTRKTKNKEKSDSISLEQKIQQICADNDLQDPMVLLVAAANGIDLTRRSKLYEMLVSLEEEFIGDVPDYESWVSFIKKAKKEFRYMPISQSAQLSAQKNVAEYLHAKKKSVDVNANANVQMQVSPLSRKEARIFTKAFNREY